MEERREQENGDREAWSKPELKVRGDLTEITRAASGPGTTDFMFADKASGT